MTHVRLACHTMTALCVAALVSRPTTASQRDGEQREPGDRKPSLSLKVNPPVGFSPLRVRVAAEFRGGADDYVDFYCPSIEWDWGDGTVSENSEDCSPYEAGKSEIRRRFSNDHVYRQADGYRIVFRLKQKSRVVASAAVMVQVRPGLRDSVGP